MTEFLSCRRILSIMVLVGSMFHHMIRVNMSIAIVDMITNSTDDQAHFDWNEEQKNDVLGLFFWGYLLTQVPGGRLSEIFGTRIVLGTSMLLSSILTLLVPAACYLHFYCIIAARVCLGFVMGVQWPSIPPIASRWIPPSDSSKFMSNATASSLGIALTLPACGILIAYFGWPSVFYVTGSLVFVWSLAWFCLVYDTPSQHPRISKHEREKLEEQTGCGSRNYDKQATPWAKILTSGPVWAIICANTCSSFTTFIVMNQLPSYMYQILHFNIKENGLISAMPYVGKYSMAVAGCYLADRSIKSQKFSIATTRKIFNSLCFLGPTLLFIIQIFAGDSRLVSIMVFTISMSFNGFGTAGFYTNCLDIAPTYSGTVYGLSNTSASIFGYVSTKLVGLVTKERQDFHQWTYIFWVLVVNNFVGFLVYTILASGRVQCWDPKYQKVAKRDKLIAVDVPQLEN